jgi:hypothetical protein
VYEPSKFFLPSGPLTTSVKSLPFLSYENSPKLTEL